MEDGTVLTENGEEVVATLRRTIEEQRRTIDALVIAADRRTTAEPDSAALATWQRNLTLQQRLTERTDRIRTAEQTLRAVIDSIDAGLCIVDGDGRIIDTNQAWSAMLARVGGVAIGAGSFFTAAADHPGGLGELLRGGTSAFRRILAEQRVDPAETHEVETREGPRWWRLCVDPVRGNGAARAVLTLTDETTAVRTQDELRQTTRDASRLALVARHMDDAVVIADEQGRIE